MDEFVDIIQKEVSLIEPYKHMEKRDYVISDNDLMIGLNDIHFGSEINNHWNKYNAEIAKLRLTKYLSEIFKIKNTHNSENCYVCINGDIISGAIHITLQISNRENLVQQVMGASELISWFLSELSKDFKNVYLSVTPGNHSRLQTKKDSPKDERLDLLIPWYIKARLGNLKNVSVLECDIDTTISLIDIRGKKYLNVHGDYDKFSSVLTLVEMVDEDIYCINMGHLHHNKTDYIQGYKLTMSGSLCGMDDYCIEKRIKGVAQQLVCVCTEDGILAHYDVDLQDVSDMDV